VLRRIEKECCSVETVESAKQERKLRFRGAGAWNVVRAGNRTGREIYGMGVRGEYRTSGGSEDRRIGQGRPEITRLEKIPASCGDDMCIEKDNSFRGLSARCKVRRRERVLR
jgi:hypothetical protein